MAIRSVRGDVSSPRETVTFMRDGANHPDMSQASKVVVVTVGVSAILAAVLMIGALLG
jgi:hypothetical protein